VLVLAFDLFWMPRWVGEAALGDRGGGGCSDASLTKLGESGGEGRGGEGRGEVLGWIETD
jgi:hypothetical protein